MDYIFMTAKPVKSHQAAYLKAATGARKVIELNLDNDFDRFNTILMLFMKVRVSEATIYLYKDVDSPTAFFHGSWKTEIVIAVDDEWISKMLRRCEAYDEFSKAEYSYREKTLGIKNLPDTYDSIDDKAQTLALLAKSLKSGKFMPFIEEFRSKITMDVLKKEIKFSDL